MSVACFRHHRRTATLDPRDIRKLWRAAEALPKTGYGSLKLAFLMPLRRGELALPRAREVDLGGAEIRVVFDLGKAA